MGSWAFGFVRKSRVTSDVYWSNSEGMMMSVTPGGTFLYLWGLTTVTSCPRLASSSPTSITPILTLLHTSLCTLCPQTGEETSPGAQREPEKVTPAPNETGEPCQQQEREEDTNYFKNVDQWFFLEFQNPVFFSTFYLLLQLTIELWLSFRKLIGVH